MSLSLFGHSLTYQPDPELDGMTRPRSTFLALHASGRRVGHLLQHSKRCPHSTFVLVDGHGSCSTKSETVKKRPSSPRSRHELAFVRIASSGTTAALNCLLTGRGATHLEPSEQDHVR
jgi:hypothetical protein